MGGNEKILDEFHCKPGKTSATIEFAAGRFADAVQG
jgi:hypothetical protein